MNYKKAIIRGVLELDGIATDDKLSFFCGYAVAVQNMIEHDSSLTEKTKAKELKFLRKFYSNAIEIIATDD